MNKSMASKINWDLFSKERNTVYGIAIISIIVFHFFEDYLSSGFTGKIYFFAKIYNTLIGSLGVEWFLFLSGMGLYFSLKKDLNIKRFLHKRLKRILPAYILVGSIYWLMVDIIINNNGFISYIKDFFFISFFTNGTRTFWYVLFILIAYLFYPFIYKLLESTINDKVKLFILVTIAIFIQIIPRLLFPSLYSNIEILLCRFLVFFIGCYCGKKVYRKENFNKSNLLKFLFGLFLAICSVCPVTKKIIQFIGFRFLMCFWGIFLLFVLVIVIKFLPKKMNNIFNHFGTVSYELYLTHVAIRAFLNTIGIYTYHVYNYMFCIVISIILTLRIVKLQKEFKYAK